MPNETIWLDVSAAVFCLTSPTLTHPQGNILPDSNAAPALQASQKALDRHMRADSLEHKIQARPKPEQLVKEGILEENETPIKE